jgi:hypothetical protein
MPDESSAENTFLHAGQGAENANGKSRQCFTGNVPDLTKTILN